MNATEYEAQKRKLAQRQALAQALQQQGLSGGPGGQMVSGRYVAPSLLAGLAPLLSAGLGTYSGGKAEKESDALDMQRGADITKAIEEYTSAGATDKKAALGNLANTTMNPADYAKLVVAQEMSPKNLQNKRFNVGPGGTLVDETGTALYSNPMQAGGQVGKFNPGDYTPESFAKYMESKNINDLVRYVTPANPTVQVVNGVPTVVQPSRTGAAPAMAPLSSLPTELDAARSLEEAKKRGQATGEKSGAIDARALDSKQTIELLNMADPLIDQATGSMAGAGADAAAGAVGVATEGAKANAQLKVLQASLMTNMPRMEGPQSDKDVALYREAAGQIGDATVPRELKKAALKQIRALHQKYVAAGAAPSTPTAPPGQRPPLDSFMRQ